MIIQWLKYRQLFLLSWLVLLYHAGYGQKNVQDLYTLSSSQFKLGNYAEALNSNIKALKLTESGNDFGSIAYANIQVGRMHYFLHKRRVALTYFFRSREIILKHSIDSLRFVVSYNIGVMYTELGISDSALIFYKEASTALDQRPDYTNLAKLHSVIADLHMNVTHDLELAKLHIVTAENYAEKSNDLTWKAFVCIKYSIYYKFKKDLPLSIKYARLASKMYDAQGEQDGRIYGLRVLSDVLALSGDPEAKVVFDRLLVLKDSIFNVETANKIADYQTIYQTEKKVTENKLLQQENELNQAEIYVKNNTIIGLIIIALLIIITSFWRVTVVNLKKKQRELEATQTIQKEKERISRDLHDNVGGQLSHVLYSLGGMNDENVQKRTELTGNINESIKNVISNLRETIWAISDENITVNDLSDKLKVYARAMFRNKDTMVEFRENISQNLPLAASIGLNLYRIAQEIINNAFKHSDATEIHIDINVTNTTSVIIRDNGRGFDPGEGTSGGYGLFNMKGRAGESGITLQLETRLGLGTRYTLMV